MKKTISILLMLILIFSFSVTAFAAGIPEGNGSKNNPYIITNVEELDSLAATAKAVGTNVESGKPSITELETDSTNSTDKQTVTALDTDRKADSTSHHNTFEKSYATEKAITIDSPKIAAASGGIAYLDKNGNVQSCGSYSVLTNQTTLNGGWYVVNSSVTISDRITVNSDVHLILADSTKLTASRGINVSEGNFLTIYAQSTGDSMGALEATGVHPEKEAGIGGKGGSCGTVTINGGNITAIGGPATAGIGGGESGSGGTITINGGKVTATGGAFAAGIGGGAYSSGGNITINGGDVTATGSMNAAGIGGHSNSNGTSSTIIIHGGNVTATGGYQGAGIGGYQDGTGGRITITGGVVTADGDNGGAGIGGTKDSTGGNITISGGDVTANGGSYAAGIGGGETGAGGTITISGGVVTATGGGNRGSGAGIGGGKDSAGGTITISGGDVTANGGSYAAGIGGGGNDNSGGAGGAGGIVTVNGGTVEAVAGSTCNNAIGAGANNSNNATLTVSPKANKAIYVKKGKNADNSQSIDGSPFTVHKDNIIDKVQSNKYVKIFESDAPTYTVTIPSKVTLGNNTTISVGSFTYPSEYTLNVKLASTSESDNSLKLACNGEKISYTIKKDTENITVGSNVLTVAGGTESGSAVLKFSKPASPPKYAGNYKGNVTFTISIK